MAVELVRHQTLEQLGHHSWHVDSQQSWRESGGLPHDAATCMSNINPARGQLVETCAECQHSVMNGAIQRGK